MDCSRSDKGLEIHHITGRDSASPLNSFVICKDCHAQVGHTQDEERHFFEITLRYLLGQKYKLTDTDVEFMEKHTHLVKGLKL